MVLFVPTGGLCKVNGCWVVLDPRKLPPKLLLVDGENGLTVATVFAVGGFEPKRFDPFWGRNPLLPKFVLLLKDGWERLENILFVVVVVIGAEEQEIYKV